jgi:hypothetical protein
MSFALQALWSAAGAAQQAPRLAAAFQPLLAAVSPAITAARSG